MAPWGDSPPSRVAPSPQAPAWRPPSACSCAGVLALQGHQLRLVPLLENLLLRDVRLLGLLFHLHVLALRRLQLVIAAPLQFLDLRGVLALEFLLTGAFDRLLLLVPVLLFQRLHLGAVLVVQRLEPASYALHTRCAAFAGVLGLEVPSVRRHAGAEPS